MIQSVLLFIFSKLQAAFIMLQAKREAELSRCSAFIMDVYERQGRQNGRFTVFSANQLTDVMMKKYFGSHLNEMERTAGQGGDQCRLFLQSLDSLILVTDG